MEALVVELDKKGKKFLFFGIIEMVKDMKRVTYFLIIVLSFIFVPNAKAVEFNLNSRNAIFYNLNDNSILYEKNSNDKISIASLTKITTGIVAIENIKDVNESVTLTYDDFYGLIEANAAQAGFYAGETVTYKDLLYALLLPSGADAAQALARNVAGSNEAFVDLMNKKAQELGLSNTHYVNTTGLDADGHYSSMEDVTKIFKYALNNAIFKEIISTSTYTTSDGYLTFSSTVFSTIGRNNLDMPYIKGGKTGTTDDAGLCLASIGEYDKVNYMLATCGVPYVRGSYGHFIDAKTIYDYFINNFSYKNVISKDDLLVTLKTKFSKNDIVRFYANKELELYLNNDFKKEDLTYIYSGIEEITPDMEVGKLLGVVNIYNGEEYIDSIEISLYDKQEFDLGKYIDYNKKEIKDLLIICNCVMVIIILAIVSSKIKIKKKMKG